MSVKDKARGGCAMTQKQVAEEMTRRGYPMSKSRVDQIEKKALLKLRKHPDIAELFRRLKEDTL